MAGIRVRNIPKNVSDKKLKIYFSKPEHGGGRIRKIYFPLFNNDAVILYEDRKVCEGILEREHRLGAHDVEVQGLPEHMVFSTMDAQLDADASVIVQITPALRDEMEYAEGIKLIQEPDQTFRLHGNWFQLEWAWHYIDCFMQQQEVIQHEISQQPQRYAGQPMEVDKSEMQEGYDARSAYRSSPTEINRSLRKSITERSQLESEARQSRREQRGDQSAHYQEDIVDSLSYRDRHTSMHIDSHPHGDRELKSPYDLDPVRTSSRSGPQVNMDALGSNINKAYNEGYMYDQRNYSSRSFNENSDEDETALLGTGHKIPMESMVNHAHDTQRRLDDENSTFQQFSGLELGSRSSPDARQSVGRSLKEENSSLDTVHRASSTSSETQSSLYSPQVQSSPLSPAKKDGHGRSGKQSIDAVDHSLGLSKPRLPARSTDIPDRYTEDQLCHSFDIRDVKVTIYFGNIVKEETDAIVNAANEQLHHYGGIAYAILKARGREMEEECTSYVQKNGDLKTTEVTHTSGGGGIKSGHIIHAAGPMWLNEAGRDRFMYQLTRTFLNCLEYADGRLWIRSLALPAISSGVYGAPLDTCVRCFLDAVLIFTNQKGEDGRRLADIRLVNNDAESTVTSIVLVQTLLVDGIDSLTADAEKFMGKFAQDEREMNLPRGRPELKDVYSRTYVKDTASAAGYNSIDLNKWSYPSASRRRSSSLSRMSDKKSAGEVRKYDVATGVFVLSSETKHGATESSSTDKHMERTGSVNLCLKKDSNHKYSSASSASAGAKMSESLSHVTKRSTTAESIRKSTPKIKTNLISSNRMKSLNKTSVPKKSDFSSNRTNYDYGTITPTSKPAYRLHTDTSEDEEQDFGLQSLPADIHKHSFREKFLQGSSSKPEMCAICLDDVRNPKQLSKCKHSFCTACIERHFKSSKPTCPTCGALYGRVVGDQPRGGRMTHATDHSRCLQGHEHEDGMITISYAFPDGTQEHCHPQPGRPYKGISRKAFLPNSVEGREVLRLLKKAFDARLVFTIGDSRTTGTSGVLTWNDIHHKTSVSGGPTRFGYPDSSYLQRVKDELASKGVTNDK